MNTDQIMHAAPVIPVLVIEQTAHAVPLARALVAGGLKVLEVTLRTPVAMDAMKAIMAEVEGAIVGAGTVLTPAQLDEVARLGCRFAVSPGFTPRLLDAAEGCSCPLLPGAGTAAEVMQLLERGYDRQKFFPAEQAGGAPALKALSSPLAEVRFCPTGGVTPENAPSYLALPNVICIGGSWVAPKKAVEAGDWQTVTDLARKAAALSRG